MTLRELRHPLDLPGSRTACRRRCAEGRAESGELAAERPSDWEMDGDEEFLVARVPCNAYNNE